MKTDFMSLYFATILFSLLKFALPQSQSTNKYCKISPEHTMCKFPKNEPGPNCPAGDKVASLTEVQKAQTLKLHNGFRSDVATGEIVKFHCPNAADMMHMEWDTELETIALRWSMQCTPGSDTERNVERFEVGQNEDFAKSNKEITDNHQKIIKNWDDEYLHMTEEVFFGKISPNCSHFTQLVWGATKYVGCAGHSWQSNGSYYRNFICNYGPKGNLPGKSLYTPGKACSKCPPGHECTTEENHNGLCSAGLFDSGNLLQSSIHLTSTGITALIIYSRII